MTSVLITGPSRNLGRATTLALADRGADLLLVGRNLSAVAGEARDRGARVHELTADLSRLADVRAAAAAAKNLIDTGTVRPLRALIANAGLMSGDTRRTSADGHELTFAVNYLAHAQLVADLHTTLTAPARIVLLGSNTYHQNIWRRLLNVAEARWRDPLDLARPSDDPPGVAYSNAKLAILYYAHELQRHVAPGIGVTVFEPGWMPGTALGRDAPPAARAVGRALGRFPGVANPERSGPALASVALDDRWAHLRDGAFVLRDHVIEAKPVAHDRARERRLWEATAHLLAVPA
ncbi:MULTISPECIES: SDR family NAD(P)-dependent oxidoreductase [Catenuloplanes]|uniref:NAD(P)-dependent dehydrogenase (Short-subunit alcohol dehydrogenase family) n=1 Tax=Catenuloplanes niger TaxID=587534 RepID=A0AAE4CWA5_9ACTN|nr:SDR family NAD(P)-dependent oxidoreductase [Catenuloplanes niger]MDR7327040.1 NAD(P)-dependent dehydrogenase (short-subunit alcohol dehydrogenase family) [Catenuloplanes niger]